MIEHMTVSRGPWESKPSLRKAHRNTSESATQFLPALTAPQTLIVGFHVTDLAACRHHNRERGLFTHSSNKLCGSVLPQRNEPQMLSFLWRCLHGCPSLGLLPAGFWGSLLSPRPRLPGIPRCPTQLHKAAAGIASRSHSWLEHSRHHSLAVPPAPCSPPEQEAKESREPTADGHPRSRGCCSSAASFPRLKPAQLCTSLPAKGTGPLQQPAATCLPQKTPPKKPSLTRQTKLMRNFISSATGLV